MIPEPMRIMPNWVRKITQIRLGEEPYPSAKIFCEDCEQIWDDTEEEMCVCDEEEDEQRTG